jgi:epoxyqueuosine reductase
MALAAGFSRARFLSPFDAASSLLVVALPYGNREDEEGEVPVYAGRIAPFARRNYYREAVKRLKTLAAELRGGGGKKPDFRIFCNSRLPEKTLAALCGLGTPGRNGLLISPNGGSLFVIAALTLPMLLENDPPESSFAPCRDCDPGEPPCKRACPTGAQRGDGTVDLRRCIQWYASGKEERIPGEVARRWGRRLYGCTLCQDACPCNHPPIAGVETGEGPLPAWLDCRELLGASDGEIRARFKGSAMGLSWLGPAAIRRNAEMVVAGR